MKRRGGWAGAAVLLTLGVLTPYVAGAPRAVAASASRHPAVSLLDAVDFVDPQHGWAAGAGILATSNGGQTWTGQASAAATISALDFVDAHDGWALGKTVGQKPLLLRTTDGGRHWNPMHEPAIPARSGQLPLRVLRQIQFVSPTRGIGVAGPDDYPGARGRIVATDNGGKTWRAVHTPADVTAACFVQPGLGGNASDGWAVGVQGDTVWKTTDNARTWTRSFTAGSTFTFGGQVACVSPSNVWALLDGFSGMSQHSYALYHTVDAGAHWRVVVAESTAGAGPAPGTTLNIPGPGISGEELAAPDGATAFLAGGCPPCGATGTTAIGHTTDGGRAWHNEPTIPGLGFAFNMSISFVTPRRGWLVATNDPYTPGKRPVGIILVTTDGGRTWMHQ